MVAASLFSFAPFRVLSRSPPFNNMFISDPAYLCWTDYWNRDLICKPTAEDHRIFWGEKVLFFHFKLNKLSVYKVFVCLLRVFYCIFFFPAMRGCLVDGAAVSWMAQLTAAPSTGGRSGSCTAAPQEEGQEGSCLRGFSPGDLASIRMKLPANKSAVGVSANA